jgi:hypothetical protein
VVIYKKPFRFEARDVNSRAITFTFLLRDRHCDGDAATAQPRQMRIDLPFA